MASSNYYSVIMIIICWHRYMTQIITILYIKEFWRSEETCCHLDFSGKTPVKTGAKN